MKRLFAILALVVFSMGITATALASCDSNIERDAQSTSDSVDAPEAGTNATGGVKRD